MAGEWLLPTPPTSEEKSDVSSGTDVVLTLNHDAPHTQATFKFPDKPGMPFLSGSDETLREHNLCL